MQRIEATTSIWNDEEIWEGLRDPDQLQRAASALYQQYAPSVLGYLVKLCDGDHDRAGELLGVVLEKAIRGLNRQKVPCDSLKAWLYSVASHTAIDEFRRQEREDKIRTLVPLEEDQVVAQPQTNRTSSLTPEQVRAIQDVLCRLERENPKYRTLLEMELVAQCSRAEIADATGIAQKQITQYLTRAKGRFLKLARQHSALASLEQEIQEQSLLSGILDRSRRQERSGRGSGPTFPTAAR